MHLPLRTSPNTQMHFSDIFFARITILISVAYSHENAQQLVHICQIWTPFAHLLCVGGCVRPKVRKSIATASGKIVWMHNLHFRCSGVWKISSFRVFERRERVRLLADALQPAPRTGAIRCITISFRQLSLQVPASHQGRALGIRGVRYRWVVGNDNFLHIFSITSQSFDGYVIMSFASCNALTFQLKHLKNSEKY